MAQQRILLVDDEPRLLHVVGLYLSMEGFEVREAQDGTEALAILDTEQFDLAILDVMMPGVDGIEVCRHIRAQPADAVDAGAGLHIALRRCGCRARPPRRGQPPDHQAVQPPGARRGGPILLRGRASHRQLTRAARSPRSVRWVWYDAAPEEAAAMAPFDRVWKLRQAWRRPSGRVRCTEHGCTPARRDPLHLRRSSPARLRHDVVHPARRHVP